MADEDALEAALARATVAEVALENNASELNNVRQSLERAKAEKTELTGRLEAAAQDVVAADAAIATLTTALSAQKDHAAFDGGSASPVAPAAKSEPEPMMAPEMAELDRRIAGSAGLGGATILPMRG